MTHMPTYGDVDPPRGFQALVQALDDLGQDDLFSIADWPSKRIHNRGPRYENTARAEFARLAKSFSYLPDPPGKDIWQPLRLALGESGRRYVLRGDCEDAALTLLVYLLAVGIPRGTMTIVMCHIHEPGEEPRGHAVLAIETTETTLICDFLLRDGEGDIQPWDAPVFRGELPGYAARYEWISRQKPGQAAWVSCVEPPTLDDVVDSVSDPDVDTPPDESGPARDKIVERLDSVEKEVGILRDRLNTLETGRNLLAGKPPGL